PCMPAKRCQAAWRVPVSRPWPESLSSALASWWCSIFVPPIAWLARLRLAPLAIRDGAHHFVNNVPPNPNFPMSGHLHGVVLLLQMLGLQYRFVAAPVEVQRSVDFP